MPPPSYLLDTNILLRLAQPGGPYDAMVVGAVNRLVSDRTELFYTPQNAAEFWNVCTRPVEHNGLGLNLSEADRRLRLIDKQFLLLPDSEAAYREWRRITVEYFVSGIQVHDARLAAVMYARRVSHLLTLNPRDFARYPGITAVHPKDLCENRK